MQGRAARHSKKATAGVPLPLMLVDGTTTRQKIKREYEKILAALEKARTEVHRFEKEQAPNYSRWLHSHFGTMLAELRETDRRICELKQIIIQVEMETLFTGASPREAYAHVMEDRKNSKVEPDEPDGKEEKGRGRRQHSRSSPFGSGPDEAEPDFEEFFGFGKRKPDRPARRSPAKVIERIKELYRALARRLHPDVQKEMTPQKAEWWHQAQAAYQQQDAEQLEVILSLCQIEDTGTTEKTSLSVLQRISAQLSKNLRQLRMQLRKYRDDPAWKFESKGDNRALEDRT